MWVLWPNLLGFLLIIWAGTSVMVSTFFLVVWLLSFFTPGHKALVQQWFAFIEFQSAVHWAASAVILLAAFLWNVVEWWVAPKVPMGWWHRMMDRRRYGYESVD